MEVKPPIKPNDLVLTEKQQMAQHIVTNILGMVKSQWNVVIFRNDPFVWSQYFVGLTLKMPTLIVIRRADDKWIPVLKDSKLVKGVFEVQDFKEAESSDIANKLGQFIKKHPQK